MSARILLVDDEENILTTYGRGLRKHFDVDVAAGGAAGLAMIQERGPYAAVTVDMDMPGMNGIEFLTRVEGLFPDTTRIMMTGHTDLKTAMDAVNDGHVFRFLTKPCPLPALVSTVAAAVQQHRLITAERELLEHTLNGSVKVMTDILSLIEPGLFGDSQRLREHVREFAAAHELADAWEVELGAMLAPLGYVAVPASVMSRARNRVSLTRAETEMLESVPETGARLLAHIPRLGGVSRIVLYQNKNFDGSGFPPDGVEGDGIPIGARVLRVLRDLFITRSAAAPRIKTFAAMKERSGTYDPAVLDAVAAAFDFTLPSDSAHLTQWVSLKDLRVGDVLSAEVQTIDCLLIVVAGARVSPMLLAKLRNFAEIHGIQEPIEVIR